MIARGIWLGASELLRRPCPVDEPYPHIHTKAFTGHKTGRTVIVQARDCPACPAKRKTGDST